MGSIILDDVVFPGGTSGQDSACQYRRPRFNPWVRKTTWSKGWLPSPIFLPGKSHRRRSLAGSSPWGHKESVTTECGTQRPPSNLPDLHQPRALDVGGPSISTEALLQGLRGQRQRRGEFRVTRRLPVGPGVPQAQESRPV